MSRPLELEVVTRAMLAAARPKRVSRPWTAEEDALVRENYRERGPRWCASELPGRTISATRQRAAALGVCVLDLWTDEERAILRREWGEAGEKTLRGMLPGRTWCSIAQQAARMELGDPAQGKSPIEAAVVRTGLSRSLLLRVLEEEGVQVSHRPRRAPPKRRRKGRPAGPRSRSKSGFRWLVVDMDRAIEAVEAWGKRTASRMTCSEAADHCDVDKTTMRQALHLLAAVRPVEGMPARRGWSISTDDAEAAMALYREHKAQQRAARIAAGKFR